MSVARSVGRDEAEILAISALSYLASSTEQFERFLSLTGIQAADIRDMAASPEFLGSVLDFVMADESLLLAFCANAGASPERIAPAHAALTGTRFD